MDYPRLDQVTPHAENSRFAAVILAAKRARQLNAYQRQWEEEFVTDTLPPMVHSASTNHLTVALEEIAGGHITGRRRT